MKPSAIVAALLGVFVTAPIWYYLLYSILQRVEASELMWFLFWVYVPVAVFCQLMSRFS